MFVSLCFVFTRFVATFFSCCCCCCSISTLNYLHIHIHTLNINFFFENTSQFYNSFLSVLLFLQILGIITQSEFAHFYLDVSVVENAATLFLFCKAVCFFYQRFLYFLFIFVQLLFANLCFCFLLFLRFLYVCCSSFAGLHNA